MNYPMNITDGSVRIEPQMSLPEDEVHLWRIDLEKVSAEQEKWRPLLSPDEGARADRFHFSRDRNCFTATRALLRTILAGYLASEAKELVFRYSEKDKPSLSRGSGGDPLQFNVSHSGAMALLAFARNRALGVDVEKIRENADQEAIARRFFSDHEQDQLAALPPAEKSLGFFRCWTRKEAYIKATGEGLSLPLHQFDVSLKPGDTNALLSTRSDAAEASLWSLQDVPAGEGYVGAVCVRGHGWQLRCEPLSP